MKANELRIGNWYDDNGIFKQVTPNTIEEVWVAERTWCKPIPLTEEWLEKLGFEICGYNQLSWRHTEHIKNFELDGINWADADYPEYQFLNYNIGNDIFRIHYVHQLQNLYFALTGEELEIKK